MDSFGKTVGELRRMDAIKDMQKLIDEMELNKLRIEDLVESNRSIKSKIVEIYEAHFQIEL